MSGDTTKPTTTPATTFKSSTSLSTANAISELVNALGTVDTSAAHRTGKPMLQFKSRDNGAWKYGQKGTPVEEDSLWAINPFTVQHGWICFDKDSGKVLDEILVPAGKPMPAYAELPNMGANPWRIEKTVEVKCVAGTDTGIELTLKMAGTDGGEKFMARLIDAMRERGGRLPPGDDHIIPVIRLMRDSYMNKQYGRVYTPEYDLVHWMSFGNPNSTVPPTTPTTLPPSPPPSSAPPAHAAEELPRRRPRQAAPVTQPSV